MNQKLTESLQNNLADCILMFFLEQNLNLSHNDFELISNEITKLFPNEIKVIDNSATIARHLWENNYQIIRSRKHSIW